MVLHGVFGCFLAGVLLVNGVPHFIRGICGRRHMTPFKRDSSAVLNVLWGFVNFIVGEATLRISKGPAWECSEVAAFWIGGFVIAVFLAAFWSNPEARLPWHKD
jgi:hypothetical protein